MYSNLILYVSLYFCKTYSFKYYAKPLKGYLILYYAWCRATTFSQLITSQYNPLQIDLVNNSGSWFCGMAHHASGAPEDLYPGGGGIIAGYLPSRRKISMDRYCHSWNTRSYAGDLALNALLTSQQA